MELKKVDKGVILASASQVNIQEFYKNVKELIDELDYKFIEKEQAQEKNQYGGRISFKFEGSKKLNAFGKKTMKAEMRFENIKSNKCDIKIVYEFNAELDYTNKWDKSKFERVLLKIYLDYLGREKVKKEIMDIIIDDASRFKKFVRDQLKFYNK